MDKLVKCEFCGLKSKVKVTTKSTLHDEGHKYFCRFQNCFFRFNFRDQLIKHLTTKHGLPCASSTLWEGYKDPTKRFKVVATPLKKVIGNEIETWFVGETTKFWNYRYSEERTRIDKCTDGYVFY